MEETKTCNNHGDKACDCENLKLELEQVKADLTKTVEINKKYEEAYRELVNKYNKLRLMLDNVIEYSIGSN